MASIQDALQKPPPGGTGTTGNPCRNYKTDVTATASTVELVLPEEGGIPREGTFVSWRSSVNCCIRVGKGSGIGAATTDDFELAAGEQVDWWHDGNLDTHFSVIRADSATDDGTIKRYRSRR